MSIYIGVPEQALGWFREIDVNFVILIILHYDPVFVTVMDVKYAGAVQHKGFVMGKIN